MVVASPSWMLHLCCAVPCEREQATPASPCHHIRTVDWLLSRVPSCPAPELSAASHSSCGREDCTGGMSQGACDLTGAGPVVVNVVPAACHPSLGLKNGTSPCRRKGVAPRWRLRGIHTAGRHPSSNSPLLPRGGRQQGMSPAWHKMPVHPRTQDTPSQERNAASKKRGRTTHDRPLGTSPSQAVPSNICSKRPTHHWPLSRLGPRLHQPTATPDDFFLPLHPGMYSIEAGRWRSPGG